MFQFRRFPSYTYFIQCTMLEYCSSGFPHSDIHGSMLMCSSPWLFAACHVLHRLLMPRHSPCALISLTYMIHSWFSYFELCRLHKSVHFSEIVIVTHSISMFHNLFSSLFASLLPCFSSSLFSFQGAVKDTLAEAIASAGVPSKLNIVRNAEKRSDLGMLHSILHTVRSP